MAAIVNELPPCLAKLLHNIAKEHDFESHTLTAKSFSTQGANYMGSLYTIDLQKGGKQLHLFAKISNTPEKARGMLNAQMMYEREVFAYTELAEAFDELQLKHDVPEEERFRFPKFYGSDLTELEEVIVMENLSMQGYVMYDRCQSMDWEYAKAAVQQLARYHALSYALEKEDPDKYNTLIRSKKESMMANYRENPDIGTAYAERMFEECLSAVDPEHVSALQRFIEKFQDHYMSQFEPVEYSVLAHGDYRISNHMVKYEDGILTSLATLDYQTIYHGSPINDLLYLLFTGSDADFRRRHYHAFIQLYRDSLARALAALSHDIDTLYPHSLFLEHLRDKLLYGLGVAVMVLPMVLVTPGEQIQLEDLVDETSGPRVNKLFRERFRGVVRDMVRWGALEL